MVNTVSGNGQILPDLKLEDPSKKDKTEVKVNDLFSPEMDSLAKAQMEAEAKAAAEAQKNGYSSVASAPKLAKPDEELAKNAFDTPTSFPEKGSGNYNALLKTFGSDKALQKFLKNNPPESDNYKNALTLLLGNVNDPNMAKSLGQLQVVKEAINEAVKEAETDSDGPVAEGEGSEKAESADKPESDNYSIVVSEKKLDKENKPITNESNKGTVPDGETESNNLQDSNKPAGLKSDSKTLTNEGQSSNTKGVIIPTKFPEKGDANYEATLRSFGGSEEALKSFLAANPPGSENHKNALTLLFSNTNNNPEFANAQAHLPEVRESIASAIKNASKEGEDKKGVDKKDGSTKEVVIDGGDIESKSGAGDSEGEGGSSGNGSGNGSESESGSGNQSGNPKGSDGELVLDGSVAGGVVVNTEGATFSGKNGLVAGEEVIPEGTIKSTQGDGSGMKPATVIASGIKSAGVAVGGIKGGTASIKTSPTTPQGVLTETESNDLAETISKLQTPLTPEQAEAARAKLELAAAKATAAAAATEQRTIDITQFVNVDPGGDITAILTNLSINIDISQVEVNMATLVAAAQKGMGMLEESAVWQTHAENLIAQIPNGADKSALINYLTHYNSAIKDFTQALYEMQMSDAKQIRVASKIRMEVAISSAKAQLKAVLKQLKAEKKKKSKEKLGIMGKVFQVLEMILLVAAMVVVIIVCAILAASGIGLLILPLLAAVIAIIVLQMMDCACGIGGIKRDQTYVGQATKAVASVIYDVIAFTMEECGGEAIIGKKATRDFLDVMKVGSKVLAGLAIVFLYMVSFAFVFGGAGPIKSALLDTGVIKNKIAKMVLGVIIDVVIMILQIIVMILVMVVITILTAGIATAPLIAGFTLWLGGAVGAVAANIMVQATLATIKFTIEVAKMIMLILTMVLAILTCLDQINNILIGVIKLRLAEMMGKIKVNLKMMEMLMALMDQFKESLQKHVEALAKDIGEIQETNQQRIAKLSRALDGLWGANNASSLRG